jgi:hypothetical protein
MRKSAAINCLSVIDCRLDSRYQIRLAGRARSLFQSDDVDDIILTLANISLGGFQTVKPKLVEGRRLIVDVPALGERLVEVRWVRGSRAGCRFSKPLTREELLAVAGCGEE